MFTKNLDCILMMFTSHFTPVFLHLASQSPWVTVTLNYLTGQSRGSSGLPNTTLGSRLLTRAPSANNTSCELLSCFNNLIIVGIRLTFMSCNYMLFIAAKFQNSNCDSFYWVFLTLFKTKLQISTFQCIYHLYKEHRIEISLSETSYKSPTIVFKYLHMSHTEHE